MRISGETTLHAPVERVWEALLDPAVLVQTIPGCERLETTGEHAYAMTVTAGVAAIRGTYTGSCTLADLRRHESLVLSAQGAGAPGTIGAEVQVRFADLGDGTTGLAYDAEAVVGGTIGGVGQRMLGSVGRRLANEFFGNVDHVLVGLPVGTAQPPAPLAAPGPVPAPAAQPAAQPATAQPGQVFTAPAGPGAGTSREFLAGVAVGAGLVGVGVALGIAAGRRR